MTKVPGLSVASYKAVAGGFIHGTQAWSISTWLSLSGGTAPTQNNVTTDSGNIGSQFGTWWATIKADNSPNTGLQSLSLYYYPAGATTSTLLGHDEFASIPGTGTGTELPSQLSLVHSYRSSTPGRSGRGRFYAPVTSGDNLTAGQMSGSRIITLGTHWKTLVDGLNALASASGQTMRVGVASFTSGVFHPAVSLVIDSKLDTQRRREDKIGINNIATGVVAP